MIKPAVILLLFLLTGWWSNITRVSRVNKLKTVAGAAFTAKQYAKASAAWARVLHESKNPNPAVRLNLAHAYNLQGKTVKAAREYQQVVKYAEPKMRSVAQQQLGNQLAKAGDYESAIRLYTDALKSNPKNNQARYNYELLLKQIQKENEQDSSPEQKNEEEKPSPDALQNKQQPSARPELRSGGAADNSQEQSGLQGSENGIPQQKNQGNGPGEETGENNSEDENVDSAETPEQQPGSGLGEETTSQKLQQINMSEERAKMLLNAMRDAEQQYLQQLPRRQKARPQKGKPEW